MAAMDSSTTPQRAREDRAIYRALGLLEKRLRKPGESFSNPRAVRQYLALHLAGFEREVFSVLWLDAQHRLIAAEHCLPAPSPKHPFTHAKWHGVACR